MKQHTRILLFLLCLVMNIALSPAQRPMDKLDRGLVAVPATQGNLVSWRVFGEEYYDVTYNLYCNGTRIATNLRVSNYNHTAGNSSSQYQVAAVVRGVEQELSEAVTRWNNGYFDIPVKGITDRKGADVTADYTLNDVTLADVDGDGVVEFIVKRPCSKAWSVTNKTEFNVLDCYTLKGERLWWIDLGPNMLSGPDEQWDCVGFDWDGDGKAEIIMRGQDNMIIHHADGTTTEIGDMSVDTRWDGIEYTSSGKEYLLYLEGATGKIYTKMDYPLTRGSDSDWGSGIVGHRSTKHYFGAPFLDGRHASIFIGRGCYTKHKMAAYDVDPLTHALTQRWYWENNVSGSPWFGQGYHNFAIADVDWDGRDEIVMGSMVIDDNGKGLSTTGYGHGDAQHCGDLDPYRHGQEQFTCNETMPNMNYRDATTSTIYYRSVGSSDDGRALCANFSNSYPGSVGRSVNTGMVSSVADKIISELGSFIDWSDLSFRFYWDGDLCSEVLDSPGSEARDFKIEKPGVGRLFTTSGCSTNNSSKNNPGATGDIFGDWREELVCRTSDNTRLRIFVSPYYTSFRIPTLWHDHQYRNAMVWQSVGYNQPPHPSFFLGELEGITVAPPPLTMTGRKEIANGGTITTSEEHLIVCETSDSHITIAEGASPYIVTFNVPSWVQGNAASNVSTKPAITYEKYTCDVTGGALTGKTRLVKQGDGVLNLPAVEMTYTGNTDVWAGILNFNGTLLKSSLWLNRFAELNTSGSFRSIKADYASVIRPGGENTFGAFTTDTLLLGFGSKIQFDVNDEQNSDLFHAKHLSIGVKSSAAWLKYGPKFLAPVFEFVHHGAGEKLAEGKYFIGKVESVNGNLESILLTGVSGQKAYLTSEDGKIFLNIEGVRGASSVVWTGKEGSTWDFALTENFESLYGDKEVFVEGDKVTFNESAQSFDVSLTGELEPDTLLITGSHNYSFGGTGKLVGNTTFVMEGTGTVSISGENSYTGGNRISGGVVKVSSLSNQYQAAGNLGAVTSKASDFVIENGGVLQTTAAVQMGSPMSMQSKVGGVINNGAEFAADKIISGTKLEKKGSGMMKLYTNNSSLDTLAISSGTVQANCDVPAKFVVLQGGNIDFNNSSSTPVHVVKGKSGGIYCYSDRGTYSNRLTGAGTVTIYYPLVKGSGWYATRALFNGNWSAFEGIVRPTGVNGDMRFCLNNSNGMPKGTFDIASGVEVQNSGKTFKVGAVTGSGKLGGVCTFSNSGATGTNTWQVGSLNSDFEFAGSITGSGTRFEKVGTGTMKLSGQGSNHTGLNTISEGTLCLNNAKATSPMLGTGALTVKKGAALTGTGLLGQPVTVTSGAILRPGVSETSVSGELKFSGRNVTVSSGASLQFYVSGASLFTRLSDIGTLTIQGDIVIHIREGIKVAKGKELQLWAADVTQAANATFSIDGLPGEGLYWDVTDLLTEGILRVTDDPELSVARLLVEPEVVSTEYYDLRGTRLDAPQRGIFICRKTMSNGSVRVEKVVLK
ncbi:MAG: autotransporter-associated beta strand repeat-containing protein [Bacteroidaceae bacterium]|nr:autotransporter-associated beta strand repeat-containing protein [Bacteroidaceae bacterium]